LAIESKAEILRLEMATVADLASQAEKSTKPLYRRRGCKILLLAILLVPALCYAATWLFARFGGEWATSLDLPLPPESQFLLSTFEDKYGQRLKHSLYASQATPEDLREWFVRSHIPMSPIPLNAEGTSFIESDNHYITPSPFHSTSSRHRFHELAAMITHGHIDEVMPDCQSIRIYKTISLAENDFPNLDFSNAEAVFSVTTCWPNLG
jgi:hypothetical protein